MNFPACGKTSAPITFRYKSLTNAGVYTFRTLRLFRQCENIFGLHCSIGLSWALSLRNELTMNVAIPIPWALPIIDSLEEMKNEMTEASFITGKILTIDGAFSVNKISWFK